MTYDEPTRWFAPERRRCVKADPATSVVDEWGRSHDHENLFVVGAPTCVSGGCANATLPFCALALRSASEIAR